MSMIGVPLKAVMMFHADSQNESITAEGWEICDGRLLSSGQQDINPGGTYQLPDLRNVFILGADITAATAYAGDYTKTDYTGAPGPKGQSGANKHTNTVGEMVPHNHGITDPGHYHTIPPGQNSGSNNGGIGAYATWANSSGPTSSNTSNVTTGIQTQNNGSGTAWDIRSRFYALVYMMKVRI